MKEYVITSEEIVWWKPSENVKQRRKSTGPQKSTARGGIPTVWTDEKVQQLIALYPNHTNAELSELLSINEGTLANKAFKLRLFKCQEFMKKCWSKSAFKKGHVPASKGKKLSAEQYEKMKPNMFKKGQVSINTLYDGAIRTRKDNKGTLYNFIRLAPKKWGYQARYVWEQHNGPIEKGKVIRHINGDTLDDRLENLELLTKHENMLRNSASVNLTDNYVANTLAWHDPQGQAAMLKHPELIELKREQLKLARTIKSKTDDH